MKDQHGEWLFRNVTFIMNHDEKIGLISRVPGAMTAFFDVLAGEVAPTEGNFEFGQTITTAYLPNENDDYFSDGNDLELMDWLRQFSEEKDEQFVVWIPG